MKQPGKQTHSSADALQQELLKTLGPDSVACDLQERAFFSTDVYSAGDLAALVVSPESADQLQAAVRLCSEAGFAMLPRGGGMSYTGGYVPTQTDSVIFDMSRMNRILEVDENDMVITVEAGVTWAQIYAELKPRGLRLPFFGTFSGARATVGGGLSNGALFMGTARHGTAAEIVLAMDVVCSGGRLVRTGQSAFRRGRPAFRTYGPDLTGVFTHDAGSLGIKSRASLRMIEKPAAEDFLSFAFDDETAAIEAVSAIARSGAAEEVYLFDPATTARSLDPDSLKADLLRLGRLMKGENNLLNALKSGAKAVSSGRSFIDKGLYSLHLTCAGRSRAAVVEDLKICSERASLQGGVPISNSIPKTARRSPFEPLNSILGSDGERWAALNAKVPHSDAPKLIRATREAVATFETRMDALGVSLSFLYLAISNHVFSYEPVLRWHDEWLPIHHRTPERGYLAKLNEPAPSPEARVLVGEIRETIVKVFADFGAASNQIGKTYHHLPCLNPETRALLKDIKSSLDPDGLMNPGALEGGGVK